MTVDDQAGQVKHTPERQLKSYYHMFDPTGCDLIDAILESIAKAGRSYHHTSEWNESATYDNPDGQSHWETIQSRANDAAKTLNALAGMNPTAVVKVVAAAERVLPPERGQYGGPLVRMKAVYEDGSEESVAHEDVRALRNALAELRGGE